MSQATDEPLFSRSSSTTDYDIKVRSHRPCQTSPDCWLSQVRKSAQVYTNKKWCLCIGVAILIVGAFTAAGIYFGCEFWVVIAWFSLITNQLCPLDEYLKANEPISEKVFGGQFKVLSMDQVHDPGSIFHLQQTEKFRKSIHNVLNQSPLSDSYKGTEVFLLER